MGADASMPTSCGARVACPQVARRARFATTAGMIADLMMLFGLGYLLGSIPFGFLLTRLAGKGDVRSIGSGNIGATNVLRTGSKALAAATLLLDIAKGALAVWIAQNFFSEVPAGDQA